MTIRYGREDCKHIFRYRTDGFKVFHNFVRENVKDKTTPAEKCGINFYGNAWENLLLNSLNNQKVLKEVFPK